MESAYEALPQRAPRLRRQDNDAAQRDAATAAAAEGTGGGEKRARDAAAPPDEAELARQLSRRSDAELPGTVAVAWSEAAAAEHYEYMDHTADIQLHAWGATVEEAFGWTALCMFNYMTPLAGFADEEADTTRDLLIKAHDMQSLLFAFLDELLFVFSTEMFVVRELRLGPINRDSWELHVTAVGSRFTPGQHEQGTEVKAITYSAMQIHDREGDAEVFCIVDI